MTHWPELLTVDIRSSARVEGGSGDEQPKTRSITNLPIRAWAVTREVQYDLVGFISHTDTKKRGAHFTR